MTHTRALAFNALDDLFVSKWTAWYRSPTKDGAAGLLHWLSSREGRDLIGAARARIALQRVHIPGLRDFSAQVHSSKESLRIFIRTPHMVPQAASEFLGNMQRYLARVRD